MEGDRFSYLRNSLMEVWGEAPEAEAVFRLQKVILTLKHRSGRR
jgi:hypothetical protein